MVFGYNSPLLQYQDGKADVIIVFLIAQMLSCIRLVLFFFEKNIVYECEILCEDICVSNSALQNQNAV